MHLVVLEPLAKLTFGKVDGLVKDAMSIFLPEI